MSTNHKDIYEVDFTKHENYVRLPYLYQESKVGFKKGSKNSTQFAKDPTVEKEAWWFSDSDNFKTAYIPYNHNYHHILPAVSLSALTTNEKKLLQSAGYNLNGPENMIILPMLWEYGVALKLPDHPGAHVKYNKAVKSIVDEIKIEVSTAEDGHSITSDNVGDIKSDLVDWQKRQFKELVKYGKNVVAKMDPEAKRQPNQVNKSPIASSTAGG